ncbi:MAG: hypothetical protein QM762_26620 [Chryseolinea sp.]
MNSLINLMAMLGVQKTLIIAGGKFAENNYCEISDDVSLFFLPDNMLHRYDAREKARLQMIIEKSQCSQVIYIGMLDDEMKFLLSYNSALHSLRAGLLFKTPLLPQKQDGMDDQVRIAALLEQHVMTQCNHLMDFHFVREKIRKGELSVKGIVGTSDTEEFKVVFTNGVRFNDFASMN